MTKDIKLSVNINKVALIRNSRNEGVPNLEQVAKDCEKFGAQGITVHPRPDERHIRYSDIPVLKACNTTEFNIEGYPNDRFIEMVLANKPHQVTLVPDPPGALTSSEGWDTIGRQKELKQVVKQFTEAGIRVSIFLDPNPDLVSAALDTGTDRIELYTGDYAKDYHNNPSEAIKKYVATAELAHKIGLGVNAGHDLDTNNLIFFGNEIPFLKEVSIGHALISDALYNGLELTIARYLRCLD